MAATEQGAATQEAVATTNAAALVEDVETESFQCVVCLDVLYKPIVLECGHISCFWCVQKAMNGLRESNCAICRHSYNHFPCVCQLLHCLVRKIEPVAYKRREKEVFEEEKSIDMFSQFGEEPTTEALDAKLVDKETDMKCSEDGKGLLCVSDVLCARCDELLFEPAVLNCGHVYCGSCMDSLVSESIICQVCQNKHPGEPPKVCLDLDQFLEKQFANEYAQRRDSFQSKVHSQIGNQSSSSTTVKKRIQLLDIDNDIINGDLPDIHVGIGCDSCGLFPIYGKRYRCKDCREAAGYDLCEQCYSTSSKIPGRFSQKHTADHNFVLDDSKLLFNILRGECEADHLEITEG